MSWTKNNCKETKAYSEQILESIVERLGLDMKKYNLDYIYDIYTGLRDSNKEAKQIFFGMKEFMRKHNYPQFFTDGARKASHNNPFVLGRYWNPKSVCDICKEELRLSDGKCMTVYLPSTLAPKTDWKCYACIENYIKEINKEWGGCSVMNSETGDAIYNKFKDKL